MKWSDWWDKPFSTEKQTGFVKDQVGKWPNNERRESLKPGGKEQKQGKHIWKNQPEHRINPTSSLNEAGWYHNLKTAFEI